MERLIVFALLFLLPTQFAYHFWPQTAYIYGLRVDYLAPAIYVTDILIVLLLPYIKKRLYLLFPVIFFALVNTVFAQLPQVSLLKWLAIFKLIVLGTYVYSCDLHKLKKTIVLALTLSLITVFLIGLTQFILQKTVGGPLYYLGERSFTSQTPGISLMNLFGKNLMRVYSTFSHPNSFAGFVVVSFLVLLSFKKHSLLFVIVILSLLLTFSLNAIVGICFVATLLLIGKYSSKTIKKIKILLPTAVVGFSLLFGAASLLQPKEITLMETYKERIVLAGKGIKAFSERPLFGVGLNNFFFATKSVQPPHNIYLIVFAETGIIGVLVLYGLLSKLLNRKLNNFLFLAIVFVLITGLFDHYWFTLQQNQLLLSILLGLSTRKVYY